MTQSISLFIPAAAIMIILKLIKELCSKKIFFFSFSILLLVSVFNFAKLLNIDNSSFVKNEFDYKLYLFSKNELKGQNWGYYSNRYWSNWKYNERIMSSKILLDDNCKLPLEISPYFDLKNRETYFKNNSDYPIKFKQFREGYLDSNDFFNFFKKKNFQYIYVENSDRFPLMFKRNFSPYLINGKAGIWKKNQFYEKRGVLTIN